MNQRGRPRCPEIAQRRDAPAGRSVDVVLCPSAQRIEHVQRALFHGDGGLFARELVRKAARGAVRERLVVVGNTGRFEIWDAKRYEQVDADIDLGLFYS